MTIAFVRKHLPVVEDEIVWPQLVEGVQLSTPVEAFCNLFTDAPDSVDSLRTIDPEGTLGFRPYLEALGYGKAEITQ